MSHRVLKEHGIDCDVTRAAKIFGYELSIRPRVNLLPHPNRFTFGGLAEITHQDIEDLYLGLREDFGITYHPVPVLAVLDKSVFQPALCYISLDINDGAPDPDYVRSLAECATELSAPESYIQHILSFV